MKKYRLKTKEELESDPSIKVRYHDDTNKALYEKDGEGL